MKNIRSTIAVATLALSIIGATAAPAIASTLPDAPKNIHTMQAHVVGGSHGYLDRAWWGFHLHLDAYAANKVIGGEWLGSGGAGLLAAVGASSVAAPVSAAILAMAAGGTQLCQHKDNTVDIYSSPAGAPYVCNPLG